MSTHLNWGTSYLVHDLYRGFLNRGATEKHYVMVGRIVTALLMVVAASLTYILDTAAQSFQLLLSIGAGTGLLYLARWFWWRVNAWSEVAAMASSFVVAIGFFIAKKNGAVIEDHVSLIWTVTITSIVWITVTFVSPATDRATLVSFYKLVRPGGPGWSRVRAEAGVAAAPDSMPHSLLGWVCGCLGVYSALFGTGSFIYGKTAQGLVWLVALVVSVIGLASVLRRPEPAEAEGARTA
jgi:Na+/proline symporter